MQLHLIEAAYRVKGARKQLYSKMGRQPDDEEVAKAAGLSMKRLNTVLMTPKSPRSLDQKIGDNMNLKPSVCFCCQYYAAPKLHHSVAQSEWLYIRHDSDQNQGKPIFMQTPVELA